MSVRARAVLLSLSAAAGCHGCREDHPYVPYSIQSDRSQPATPGGVPANASAAPSPVDDGGLRGPGEPAMLAPPGTARWALEDAVLEAPPGRIFTLAVLRDFDADGVTDAFAIVRAPEGNDPGELAYYHGTQRAVAMENPVPLAPPAGLWGRDPDCTPIARLVAVGRRSVLAELGAACPHASSSPDRWLAIVAGGGASPVVRLAATIADPPGAATLSVDADTLDRDGDGLEDLALSLTIEGGGAPLEPGPRVSTTLAWLDRSAGLSRDMAITEASFASLASTAAARAVRSKDAPAVPGLVAQVRALWRAVCADGGSPRLVGVAGTGAITCGGGRALESAGLAEARAYVTLGDALRAALALDRAERQPASRSASRHSEMQGWITQLAPVVTARFLRAVAAVPIVGRGHEPSWGPLAFEPTGKLLVRTRAGVVRVDPETGDEALADGVEDWNPAVTSSDGTTRWIESYDACDGLPLHATFAASGGDDLRDVSLPVPPPLGNRCVGSRGAPARAIPLAWGPAGIEAIVEGEPLLISPDLARASPSAAFLRQPVTLGAPRSPDGNAMVVATGMGLLVKSESHSRFFRASELDGTYGEQRDCAVSDGASRVSCVHSGKAWVGTWNGP